jgi:hypothetical protein
VTSFSRPWRAHFWQEVREYFGGRALGLYFFHRNFCRQHKTLRTSPAMAAGFTDELPSMESLCAIMDAASPPKKRGPYKSRLLR